MLAHGPWDLQGRQPGTNRGGQGLSICLSCVRFAPVLSICMRLVILSHVSQGPGKGHQVLIPSSTFKVPLLLDPIARFPLVLIRWGS